MNINLSNIQIPHTSNVTKQHYDIPNNLIANVSNQLNLSNIQMPDDKPHIQHVYQDPNNIQMYNQGQVYTNNNPQWATVDEYQKNDDITHALNKPGMYIGSITSMPKETRLLDISDKKNIKFYTNSICWPDGAERLFLEILTNASDNVIKSRETGFNPGKIVVTMDHHRVTIRNGGRPIPVAKNTQYNEWTPEMILGNLKSGSNLSDKTVRTGAGTHGMGASLTNIFSTEFVIKVGDPQNGLEYYQVFTNNMRDKTDPVITPFSGEPYVEISYCMDFPKFYYSATMEEYYNNIANPFSQYPDYVFNLYARHCADIAYSCKVPVIFNGIELKCYDIFTYAKWIGNYSKNYLIHYEWPPGTPLINKKIGNQTVKYTANENIMPTVELCIIDAPDVPELMRITAYVNCMTTTKGTHIEAAQKQVVDKIGNIINNMGNGKKDKDTKSRKFRIMPAEIKRHLTIIISCNLTNPDFRGQYKEELLRPRPSIKIDDDVITKKIKKWDLMDRLYAELNAKQFKAIVGKGKSGRKKHINDYKGIDADLAGTDQSLNCACFIVEGSSAKTAAVKCIKCIPNGSDYYGVIPLKGKPLNSRKAGLQKYAENEEIQLIKDYFNLVEGVDYRLPENYSTLRYGKMILMADADDDGWHIDGLMCNLVSDKFPSLLHLPGFITVFRTPIVKVNKGARELKFYTQTDLSKWRATQDSKGKWQYRYFKGLGKLEDEDAEDEMVNPKMTILKFDPLDESYFNLVFGKNSDDRKKWIVDYKPYDGIENYQELPFYAFLNYEVIKHSVSSVQEKIPAIDGFKKSQRKIIWGCENKFKGNPNAKTDRVANVAGYCIELTNYHHGESSLQKAINRMAQTYPGTNNINLLYPAGEHGSRLENGKDATAPRYAETKPSWSWKFIFKDDDKDLLELIQDEDKTIEPKFMLPIIPLILANGSKSIGTGFASIIPSFNVYELCQEYLDRLDGKAFKDTLPYFEGFKGKVEWYKKKEPAEMHIPDLGNILDIADLEIEEPKDEIIDDITAAFPDAKDESKEKEYDEDEVDIGLENIGFGKGSKSDLKVTTRGIWEYDGSCVYVTEIPIGRSITQYRNLLTLWKKEKKIRDFKHTVSDVEANFRIFGFNNPSDSNLKLISNISLGNITLLDLNGVPKRYKHIKDVKEDFFQFRYPYYVKRKNLLLKEKIDRLDFLYKRRLFIYAVMKGQDEGYIPGQTVIIFRKSKQVVIEQTALIGIDADRTVELLDKVKSRHYTNEELNKMTNEIQKAEYDKHMIETKDVNDFWREDIRELMNEIEKRGSAIDKGRKKNKRKR